MFEYNNKVERNLQEQVLKNQADIKDIFETSEILAKFGIMVVGSVTTADQLPDPTTFTGDYGEAYTVGTEAPYDYYIFTRPNAADPNPQNRWLDIGEFPLPGPKGETGATGPQGPKGEIGSKWLYSISTSYPGSITANVGDFFLGNSGNVYTYEELPNGKEWTYLFSIKGPQGVQGIQGLQGPRGIQGPKGDKGDQGQPGYVFVIRGTLDSVSELPKGLTTMNNAFLVGTAEPYDLYVQVGDDPGTADYGWKKIQTFQLEGYVTDTELTRRLDDYLPTSSFGNYITAQEGIDQAQNNRLTALENKDLVHTEDITQLKGYVIQEQLDVITNYLNPQDGDIAQVNFELDGGPDTGDVVFSLEFPADSQGVNQLNIYLDSAGGGSISRSMSTGIPAGTYYFGGHFIKCANSWYEPLWSRGTQQYSNNIYTMTKKAEFAESASRIPAKLRIQSVSGTKLPNAKIQVYMASSM